MKRYGIVAGALSGVAALAGAGTLVVAGALPGSAATEQVKSVAASNSSAIAYTTNRGFEHSREGYHATATLPKTWKEIKLASHQTRFDDAAHQRMIRFDTTYNDRISTVTAMNNKIKALKGTRQLRIVGTSTVTMGSTLGQGPQTVSTLVYTYRSGSQNRWVATRYIGQHGYKTANLEISVAGSTADSKLLGDVINKATLSFALYG